MKWIKSVEKTELFHFSWVFWRLESVVWDIPWLFPQLFCDSCQWTVPGSLGAQFTNRLSTMSVCATLCNIVLCAYTSVNSMWYGIGLMCVPPVLTSPLHSNGCGLLIMHQVNFNVRQLSTCSAGVSECYQLATLERFSKEYYDLWRGFSWRDSSVLLHYIFIFMSFLF